MKESLLSGSWINETCSNGSWIDERSSENFLYDV